LELSCISSFTSTVGLFGAAGGAAAAKAARATMFAKTFIVSYLSLVMI
jgi:hypothetical protein